MFCQAYKLKHLLYLVILLLSVFYPVSKKEKEL